MKAIRQLENVQRALAGPHIEPEVQENLSAILADVIAELKAKEHPHPGDAPPNIPPVGAGG